MAENDAAHARECERSEGVSMYYTMTIIDGQNEFTDHATLVEAENFARDISAEGNDCTVLMVLCEFEAEEGETVVNLDHLFGVRAGRDFPVTLQR